MLEYLWNGFFFVIALGTLVAFHEFGHFWVARRFNVKVHVFSVGFGKALWSKKGKDGTEYILAAIPLGGYVKMLDGRIEEIKPEEKHLAFDLKPVWQRMAIVVAGPLANFLLAIVVLWAMFMIGTPTVKPVLDHVTPDSFTAKAGLQAGDELKVVAGQNVVDWDTVNLALISRIGDETLDVEVLSARSGQLEKHQFDIRQWQFDPKKESPLVTLGLNPIYPKTILEVDLVEAGKAGANAGLLKGDKILSVDGIELVNWAAFVAVVQAKPNIQIELTIERNKQTNVLRVIPETKTWPNGDVTGYLGVRPKFIPVDDKYRINLQFGPIDAIGKAVDRTWQLTELTVVMLGKLLSGDVSVKSLAGPGTIAKGAGMTASYGLVYFLGFLALISVNLGVINLFPLPVLDGGHLLYYCIELLTGRPLPVKVQEFGFKVGAALLIVLMSFAIFNDFN